MPTVIDSLVVELGLDPAKFTQGQKDALDAFRRTQEEAVRGGKEIEAQGKKTDEYFSGLKRQAVGLLGVFLTGRGIKEFVTYITDLDAATGRAAKTMNMSARELSAWQGAAEQTGGSAADITSSLQGMSSAMNTFMITGQGPFLGVTTQLGLSLFDVNGKLKTSGDMLLEIADAVQKLNASDPARAAALLSMIPGASQTSINMMINGRAALTGLLESARKAGGTTEESAAESAKFTAELALLERQAISTSRTLLGGLLPSLTATMKKLQETLKNPTGGKSFWDYVFTPPDEWFEIVPGGFVDRVISSIKKRAGASGAGKIGESLEGFRNDVFGTALGDAKARLAAKMTGSAFASQSDKEAFIRSEAAARGINPDVAMKVARSEGFSSYVGDRGSSFGAFQLHYGGMAGGGMAAGGMGDAFTKQTGLHARDPSTEREQIKFALDQARKSGWGAWHGWQGLPFEGIGGLPSGAPAAAGITNNRTSQSSSSSSSSVHVDNVNVYTKADDAAGIAKDIKPAMERLSFAARANYAQV